MKTSLKPPRPDKPNQHLLFDIETDGFNELTLKKKNGQTVVIKEATTIHVMWIKDLFDDSMKCYKGDTVKAGVQRLFAAKKIGGHNVIAFDVPICERLTGLKCPSSVEIEDTLIQARLLWPEPGQNPFGGLELADIGAFLGVPKIKFDGPWDKYTYEMEVYCKQDVETQDAIRCYLASLKPPTMPLKIEYLVARIIARQTAYGWGFDKELAKKNIATLEIERAKILDELQRVFPPTIETMKTPAYYSAFWNEQELFQRPTKGECEKELKAWKIAHRVKPKEVGFDIVAGPLKTKTHPFNPGSGDQIATRLKDKYDWKPEKMTDGGGICTDAEVLASLPYPEAKLLLKFAENEKLLDGLIDYLTRAENSRDGRIHGSINTQGAVTSRMTHKQPNSGNVAKHELVRTCFIGSPGRKVVGADAAALDLRSLSNSLAQFDGGRFARAVVEGKSADGTDIHTLNMKILQGVSKEVDRDKAKTFIYAFIYGAFPAKLGSVVGKGKEVGEKLQAIFFNKTPGLQKVLDKVKAQFNKNKTVELLDGRSIPCRAEYSAFAMKNQGDGGIIMKVALIVLDANLQKAGFKPGKIEEGCHYEFMGNIHDEWQLDVNEDIAERVGQMAVEAIGEAGRRLKMKVRLDGAYKVGNNWMETH